MRDPKKREGLLPKPLYPAQQLIDWEWRLRDEYGAWNDKKRGKGVMLWKEWGVKINDEDGIRTHACRAHWISSPTP